jgi:hypothetical protein
MSEVENTAAAIEQTVAAWWAEYRAPLLLSKLGGLIPSEIQKNLRLERIPLKRFIRDELEGRVRLLKMPRLGGGVSPWNETKGISEGDLERMFEERRRERLEQRIPRYNALIWDAFRTPLLDGRRRFVRIGDAGEIELSEVGDDAEVPTGDGWIEVAQQDLGHVPPAGHPMARDMDGAIRRWAEGKIEANKLVQPTGEQPKSFQVRRGKENRSLSSLSTVISGLEGFTNEELARIQIPADVLLSILRRNNPDR